MSFLKESIIDLKAKHKTNGIKIRRLNESAMPPQDMKKWLEDVFDDLEKAEEIPSVPEVTWKMVDDFEDLIDKLPEDQHEQKADDDVADAALEVYHQHVGSVAKKEKQD